MPRYLIILILTFCLGVNSVASPFFDRFSKKDGLISNQVYSIKQDNKGRIWVACTKGIGNYIGLSFVNYDLSRFLGDDILVGLTLDHQGKVWG